MQRRILDRRIALLCGVTVLALTACGSTASSGGAASSTTATATSSPKQTDALVGIWESESVTATEVDSVLRDRFTGAQVDEFETVHSAHGCAPAGDQADVLTLHFDGGQLVISSSRDGGPVKEGWTGTYVVQDANTYLTGDAAKPYIIVDFDVAGDQLTLHLIKDRFPDHSPWHMSQDGQVLDIGKPLADTMCQMVFYDVSGYTKVG